MIDILLKFIFLVVFVFVVTPIGLILRVIGIDYLNKKIDKQTKSYWVQK